MVGIEAGGTGDGQITQGLNCDSKEAHLLGEGDGDSSESRRMRQSDLHFPKSSLMLLGR